MALIVETGQGLPNAESYGSVAEADAYFEAFPNDSWAGEVADKEIALRKASRDIDLVFGPQFLSTQSTTEQGLLFPRLGDVFISIRVKRATFELAALSLGGFSPTELASDAGVTEFSYKVEGVYGETVKYGNGKTSQPELNTVKLLLAPFLVQPVTGSSWSMLRVVRG